MPQFTEPLSGGLVTSKDPKNLNPGELTQADNLTYLPYDECIHRALGRASIATVNAAATANGISGLRWLQFTPTVGYAAAAVASGANPGLWSVNQSNVSAFVETLTSSGDYLEAIGYKNLYILMNGVNDPNRVWYRKSDGSLNARRHGLLPVNITPTLTTVASAFGSNEGTGTFDYWYTEVAKFDDGTSIESAFAGTTPDSKPAPATVTITDTATQAPKLVFNAPINSETTHFRVYRGKRSDTTISVFPAGGEQVQEQSIYLPDGVTPNLSWVDGGTGTTNTTPQHTTGVNDNAIATTTWANLTNLTADVSYATCTLTGIPYKTVSATTHLSFTGFTAVKEPIVGIVLSVVAKVDSKAADLGITPTQGLTATIGTKYSPNAGTIFALRGANSKVVFNQDTVSTSDITFTLPATGTADKWGSLLNAEDFSTANFRLALTYSLGMLKGGSSIQRTVSIKALTVNVYYAGGSNSTIALTPYNYITISTPGGSAFYSEDGPPPVASTGDIFEDCLVVNNAANPSRIDYSIPGKPESFPTGDIYTIDFSTRVKDSVSCIRTVGRALGVGMKNSLWRVNYLPNEDDANFSRGRAVDLIDSGKGIVNPMASCLYTGHDGRTALAFFSYAGLFATDLFSVWPLAPDLDTRVITKYNSVQLINNPQLQELVLYYWDGGESQPDAYGANRAFHFSYAARHLKTGIGGDNISALKVSGPVVVSNLSGGNYSYARSVCVRPTSTGSQILLGYAGTGGGVLWGDAVIDSPTYNLQRGTDSTGYSTLTTRRIFKDGVGDEWNCQKVWLYLNATPNGTHTITPKYIYTNGDETTGTSNTFAFSSSGRFSRADVPIMSEGLRLTLSETQGLASANGWESLVIAGEGFEGEDSGK